MKIQFLGCGDAFGSGGRFNTCFMVDAAGTRFLIDCGASSMVAMGRAGVDPRTIDAVLLTHLHGDHFGGVPFFLVHARNIARRERPLVVAGPKTTERRLFDTLECLYPGAGAKDWGFDLDVREYEVEKEWRWGPVTMVPFRANHHAGEAPACALRVTVDGKTVAYSGDGGWSDGLAAAARDADLLIAECCFVDDQAGGSGHMDLGTLTSNLDRLAAKRVILTHLGEDMLARRGGLDFEVAEDGKTVEI